MRKQAIVIGGEEVIFRIVRTTGRQKTIALQVQPDGRIVVRAPGRTSTARVREVLHRKTSWLTVRRRIALANAMPTKSSKEFVAGESFSLLGQQRRLKFARDDGRVTAVSSGRFLIVPSIRGHAPTKQETRDALRILFRCEAARVFGQRLRRFLVKLGLREAPRVIVADQTHRWGSCNRRGELRLNWRLVGAPTSLIDYVIVHELCHLRWSDHSARFWRELRRVMPDYRHRERSLAEVGFGLVF